MSELDELRASPTPRPAHRIGLSVGGHPPLRREGVTMPVLLVRDYGDCAVFPSGGRLVASSRTDA